MIRVFLYCLLSLTVINAVAANMVIYKDKMGQVLLTNTQPNAKFELYNKKVKETYYKDCFSKDIETAQKNTKAHTELKCPSGTASYANSAYAVLR